MANLKIFYTNSFPCGYFKDLKACYLLLDPEVKPDIDLQEHLTAQGYRRSGQSLYYPWCNNCLRCVPLRLDVNDFKPNRSQKRCLKKNANTRVVETAPVLNPDIFDLYKDYQKWKHPGAGMDECQDFSSMDFLLADWADTRFNQIYHNDQLAGVAVTDIFNNSLSAVYTFYDKKFSGLSLGTYAILWQIKLAQQLNLDYLYLGYYIKDSKKMSYKANFKPHEFLLNGQWHSTR